LPTAIDLYAQTLMKVVVAQHLGTAPLEVTNAQFKTLCAALVSEPLDILDLSRCTQVCDFSGLIQLSLSELDISDCKLSAEGGGALAAVLKGNQLITKLNISSNALGMNYDSEYDESGVIAVVNAICDNGALSLLNVASNVLCAGGTKLLAEALKGNQIMTELNISSIHMTYDGRTLGEMSGVIALADVIPDMGAMSKFTFSGDYSDSKPVTLTTTMTEADFSV
jgi:hypothetical protein